MIKNLHKGHSLSSARRKERSLYRASPRGKHVGVRIGKRRRGRLININRLIKNCRSITFLACWISVAIMAAIGNQLKTMSFALLKYPKITLGSDYF